MGDLFFRFISLTNRPKIGFQKKYPANQRHKIRQELLED
jgi:hypothetical protein